MPEDLGTWSRAQADVLVKVLKRAGCRPSTEAAAGGGDRVVVTVPDEQADAANRAIAAEMDTIARAARDERERNVKSLEAARRKREKRGRTQASPSSRSPGDAPLATERLRGLAPFLGLLIVVLLVAALVPAAARFPAILVGVLVVTYAIGRRSVP